MISWWQSLTFARRSGAILLALIVLAALFGPAMATDPVSQNLDRVLRSPSLEQPLGTDHLGRSMLARLVHALQLSFSLALLSVLSAAAIGISLGLLAAWRGGVIEAVLTSIADAVMTLPVLLVVLLFSAFAQGEFWSLYVGLSFALWVEYFRVSRATIKATLVSAPVESARMLGFGNLYLLRRHLLPELAPVVGTLMLFGISTAILALAALGFVGVGLRPPTPELGVMMIELFPYYEEAPWLIASPVVTLGLIMLALALLGGRKEMP
ncbi:ABC transporter permease [Methylobacillus flagellatus]|uniref:ABC transporter permease n=1 Tax=Methylobacillus flagellatus TaxID=405 RepID=UPI002853CFA2|nr:ABC transporter permease [Methylobacillus flagellatus]MDR5172201.1 ABC transporter permease [Methylobacillus flagellatus]